jgi:NADH-quinone oxidoreductase subunit N
MLLSPELSLIITAVLVILLDLVVRQKGLLVLVSITGIIVAGCLTVSVWLGLGGGAAATFGSMMAVDNFALFFKLLFLGIAALVILSSVDYADKFRRFQGEYYALILISALGMMLMAAAAELVTIYIALELTSISLYILVGFLKNSKSIEASIKYLLLGAVASAVLLYGMALVFGVTGSTRLGEIAGALGTAIPGNPALLLGIVLLICGFGFKIAAVPFHLWVPDVYEGAPTPITAYLSVGSKAAGFAVILRLFYTSFGAPEISPDWGMIFAVLSAISMTVGNVVALAQTNIKRMLGYSSIAQAGYLMVGLAAVGLVPGDFLGQSGVIFFLAAYTFTNLGAFIAIIVISNKISSDQIDDYSGMFKRAPLVVLGFSLCLISLIGMPPAGGFMAKFYIFSAAVQHGLLWLVIIAVINSVISAYYYLRVVKVMWLGEPTSREKVPSSGALRLALSLACLGVLVLGIVPGAMMKLAQMASQMFLF